MGNQKHTISWRAVMGCKLIASLTAGLFLLSDVALALPIQISPTTSTANRQALEAGFQLPSELGSISVEHYSGNDKPFVVLVQDAHAVVDAQHNIADILSYLNGEYGIQLTALEGGKGKLDAQLLRAFPDDKIKRTVVDNYVRQGEVNGSQIAAILNTGKGDFYGIEDWKVYEANYLAFLRATRNQNIMLKDLTRIEKQLDVERRDLYSAELNTFHEVTRDFSNERVNLLELIEYLSGLRAVEQHRTKYAQLETLFNSITKDQARNKKADENLINGLFEDFNKKCGHLVSREQSMALNGARQDFRTGRQSAADMIRALQAAAKSIDQVLEIAPSLKTLLKDQQTLATIRGTRLFAELKALLAEVRRELTRNESQLALQSEYHKLELLRKLIKLELSREDYDELKHVVEAALSMLTDRELAMPAIRFYQSAIERDRVLFSNFKDLLRQSRRQAAAVVLGGFHTSGFAARLEENGYSYAIVSPQIGSLAGFENYHNVMRGKLSYGDFLKTSFYQAFMQHASEALMRDVKDIDFRRVLKQWRDRLIMNLAEADRLSEAGEYTAFVDRIVEKHMQRFASRDFHAQAKQAILQKTEDELERFGKNSLELRWNQVRKEAQGFIESLRGRGEIDRQTILKNAELHNQAASETLAIAWANMMPRLTVAEARFLLGVTELEEVEVTVEPIASALKQLSSLIASDPATVELVEALSQIPQAERIARDVLTADQLATGAERLEGADAPLRGLTSSAAALAVASQIKVLRQAEAVEASTAAPVIAVPIEETAIQAPATEPVGASLGSEQAKGGYYALQVYAEEIAHLQEKARAQSLDLVIEAAVNMDRMLDDSKEVYAAFLERAGHSAHTSGRASRRDVKQQLRAFFRHELQKRISNGERFFRASTLSTIFKQLPLIAQRLDRATIEMRAGMNANSALLLDYLIINRQNSDELFAENTFRLVAALSRPEEDLITALAILNKEVDPMRYLEELDKPIGIRNESVAPWVRIVMARLTALRGLINRAGNPGTYQAAAEDLLAALPDIYQGVSEGASLGTEVAVDTATASTQTWLQNRRQELDSKGLNLLESRNQETQTQGRQANRFSQYATEVVDRVYRTRKSGEVPTDIIDMAKARKGKLLINYSRQGSGFVTSMTRLQTYVDGTEILFDLKQMLPLLNELERDIAALKLDSAEEIYWDGDETRITSVVRSDLSFTELGRLVNQYQSAVKTVGPAKAPGVIREKFFPIILEQKRQNILKGAKYVILGAEDFIDEAPEQVAKALRRVAVYLEGHVEQISDWAGDNGLKSVLANSVKSELTDFQAWLTTLAADPESLEFDDLEQYFSLVEHIALLLGSESWLSPTYPGSVYASKGLYQAYSKRGMYERDGVNADELETAFGQRITGRSANNVLFRNYEYALATLMTELESQIDDASQSIRVLVSSRTNPLQLELLRRIERSSYRFSVNVVDMEQQEDVKAAIADFKPTTLYLDDADLLSEGAQSALAASLQTTRIRHVVVDSVGEIDTAGPLSQQLTQAGVSLFGLTPISAFIPIAYDYEEVAGVMLNGSNLDTNTALKRRRRYGGYVDIQNYWRALLLTDELPSIESSKERTEPALSSASFGNRLEYSARLTQKYQSRLEAYQQFPAEQLPVAEGELFNFTLEQLRTNLMRLQRASDELSLQELNRISEEHRQFLKLLIHFRQFDSAYQNAEQLEALVTDQYAQLNDPVYALDGSMRPKSTLITQSGMGAMRTIMALAADLNRGKQIVMGNNLYYESNFLISHRLDRRTDLLAGDERNIDQLLRRVDRGDIGAVLLDPIANSTQKGNDITYDMPAADLIRLARELSTRSYAEPFLVVFDSTVLGTEFQLSDILDDIDIPDNLHFINYTSLQKMYQDGLEIVPGGAIEVVSRDGADNQDIVNQLRAIRDQDGSAHDVRGYRALASLDWQAVRERTRKLHENAARLARFTEGFVKQYMSDLEGVEVIYPGLPAHPDHKVAAETYRSFGPFMFLRVGPQENALFGALLAQKLKERGIINYGRDSFAFNHFTLITYDSKQQYSAMRFSAGTEDETQMALIEEALAEALSEMAYKMRREGGVYGNVNGGAQKDKAEVSQSVEFTRSDRATASPR